MTTNEHYLPEPTSESFSASLDDALANHPTLAGLSESVQEKKRAVNTQEQELAALENRLRETEERLARATREKNMRSGNPMSPGRSNQAYSGSESVPRSSPLAYGIPHRLGQDSATTELSQDAGTSRPAVSTVDLFGGSRMPGASPIASSVDESRQDFYTLVERTK